MPCSVCNGTGKVYPPSPVDQSQFDPEEYQVYARMGGYKPIVCPECIGRAVKTIEDLKPSIRLKVIRLFCSRCGEQNCPDRYNCHPKE
jgi:RecJ-like exonuclease